MRDFTCCGKILPNLHDLLKHYEEAHTNSSPNGGAGNGFGAFTQVGDMSAPRMPQPVSGTTPQTSHMGQQGRIGGESQLPMGAMNEEMGAVGDMEMDDDMDDGLDAYGLGDNQRMHQTRQLFGQQQRPQLSMNTSGFASGLRTSQPTTPAAANFGLHNNPTVSSVNTPTLTTHQQPPAQMGSGMDTDMDDDFPGMPMGGAGRGDLGDLKFGDPSDASFCINDPGKSLFRPEGTPMQGNRSIQAQLAQLGLNPGQLNDPQANQILMQKLQNMMMPEEHKPFKCPVVGCEKAYKNQNGLKCV